VGKNNAISALLQGSLGFDAATTASVQSVTSNVNTQNALVILSAGHNVSGSTIAPTPVNQTAANLRIGGGTTSFTSRVTGRATGEIAAGTATFAGDTTLVAGTNLTMAAGDTLTVGGAATLTAGGNATLGNVTGTSISVMSPGTATLQGNITAPQISVSSGNIAIGANANVGGATTTAVNLTALPAGRQVTLGGTEEGPGYTLSQAEISRIRSAALNFATSAVSSEAGRGADLLIRALSLSGSAANGISTVNINTPGRIRVEGAVAMTGAAATDRLAITGAERLEVITPGGGITMRDASNQLGGILQLVSDNIVVTDSGAGRAARRQSDLRGPRSGASHQQWRGPPGRPAPGRRHPAALRGPYLRPEYRHCHGVRWPHGRRRRAADRPHDHHHHADSAPGTGTGGGTGGGTGTTTSFSFTGTLQTANEVLFFDFTVASPSEVTLRSYSYAGGTNARGETIPRGGFDPILALFDAAGALIGQNDDGGSTNVPTDPSTGLAYDVFLRSTLQPGNYKVAVSAFPNFARGPNLSDGFSGSGSLGSRTANFAFDVLGASAATGPGQNNPPAPPPPPATSPLTIAFGRRINPDGTIISGAQFFAALGFNSSDTSANFAPGSIFNGLSIGQPVPIPPAPPPVPTPPRPISGSEVIVGPIAAASSAAAAQDDGDGDGSSGPGGGFGPGFIGIIDTGQIASETLIEEPVASGGDSTLWTDGEDEEDEDEDENPGAEQ
jgi:hypothetical protein